MKSIRALVILPILALLLTHIIFLPLTFPLFRIYGEFNAIEKQMMKENDAITCHMLMENAKEAREMLKKKANISWSCDDSYYRSNTPTATINGLTVYRDTYNRYIQLKNELWKSIIHLIPVFIISALIGIAFNHALALALMESWKGNGISVLEIIMKSFKNIPFLLLAYLCNGLFLFAAALLFLFLKPIVLPLLLGALALIAPIYVCKKKIFFLDSIFHTVKSSPVPFIILGGILFGLNEIYGYFFRSGNLWMLFVLYPVNVMALNYGGALVYMLSGEKGRHDKY